MLRGRRWELRPRPGPGWLHLQKPLKPRQAETPRTSLSSFKPFLLLLLLLVQHCQAERLERVNFKVSSVNDLMPMSTVSLFSMWRGRWSTNAGPHWATTTPPIPWWPGLGPSNVLAPPGNRCHNILTLFQKYVL